MGSSSPVLHAMLRSRRSVPALRRRTRDAGKVLWDYTKKKKKNTGEYVAALFSAAPDRRAVFEDLEEPLTRDRTLIHRCKASCVNGALRRAAGAGARAGRLKCDQAGFCVVR